MLLSTGMAMFILIQTGGHALKIYRNRHWNDYVAAVEFVREHTTPDSLIMGSAELRFGLPENRYRLVDDSRLGTLSHLSPDIVALSDFQSGDFHNEPDTARHVSLMLTERFDLAARYGGYRIYLPLKAPSTHLASVAGQ